MKTLEEIIDYYYQDGWEEVHKQIRKWAGVKIIEARIDELVTQSKGIQNHYLLCF